MAGRAGEVLPDEEDQRGSCASRPGTVPSFPVRTRRAVVDYALQRRALLADVFAGRVSTLDVCDAHPYLQRAAQYHGERTRSDCPVCRREKLWQVNYVYGDELKGSAGQARSSGELPKMAMDYGEFTVYVVEVCRGCGWNHLVVSYVLGRDGLDEGSDRRAARK
jgi:Family of unknown function (DUF5318)